MPPAIQCNGLARSFGDVQAVKGLDLTVPEGAIVGLLGPNGAGKTTALRMLTTLLPPTAGSAQIAGHDIQGAPRQVRAAIGYVPQTLSAEGALSGRENLAVFAKLYGLPRGERNARVGDALDQVGLGEAAGRLAKTYSGGMIRRLEIAQALLHRPRVLFLDEPTVGLDPVARKQVWEHIQQLRRETGMAILLTTHYMEEADRLCDRVLILDRGARVAEGTPKDLKETIGRPDATLEDVFAEFTGKSLDDGLGGFSDAKRARRTMGRMT